MDGFGLIISRQAEQRHDISKDSVPNKDNVIARSSVQVSGSGADNQKIIPLATKNFIIATLAIQCVIASTTGNDVTEFIAHDHVMRCASGKADADRTGSNNSNFNIVRHNKAAVGDNGIRTTPDSFAYPIIPGDANVKIIARAAFQGVIASPAFKTIGPGIAAQQIGGRRSQHAIGARTAIGIFDRHIPGDGYIVAQTTD
jgi:hypothetical protein